MTAITTIALLVFLPGAPDPGKDTFTLKIHEDQQGDVTDETKIDDSKTTLSGGVKKKEVKGTRTFTRKKSSKKRRRRSIPRKSNGPIPRLE